MKQWHRGDSGFTGIGGHWFATLAWTWGRDREAWTFSLLLAGRAAYCIILVIFLVPGAEQRLFLVQTGVTGKAKQRGRAAVGRIQAAVGVVPRPAARDREECSET